MSLLARRAALAALVLAALLVTGCGGTVIDFSKAEDQIKASVEESPDVKVSSVDCPSGVEVEPGAKFTCAVHLADGHTETATLLIRDEDANLNFINLQPNK
jgi:NAD(P)H-hydrate repair Nnr-like enzyme with NAD(P)H-hydrate epimerase domain